MNNVFKKRIRDYILEHHDELGRRLPDEGFHKERNGTAHCYWCIKRVWNVENINDIADRDYEKVMDVLRMVVENAEDPDIEDRLPCYYKKSTTPPNNLQTLFGAS